MSNCSNCSDIPTYPPKLDVMYWEQIFTTVLIGIVAIAGLIGNSMIILAVAFSRKLQTTTNALVISLGATDLITSITLLFYMIGSLGENDWICQGVAVLVYSTVGTSIYTMASIALNRLVIVTKPHLYKKLFKSWKLVLFIVIPWIVPSFGILIWALLEKVKFGYDPGNLACAPIDTTGTLALYLYITFIGFPPLAVIIVSYIWIYVYLNKHFKKMMHSYTDTSTQNMSTDSTPTVSSSVETEFNEPHNSTDILSIQDPSHKQVLAARQKKHISRQQIKITKNLFTVVCGFLLCFLPYFILIFVEKSEHILLYTRVITFANCAINFPIYSLNHPDFKIVLRCMTRCCFAEIPQPSKFLKLLLSRNM